MPLNWKREVVKVLSGQYPARQLCELVELAPSSYYYRPVPEDDSRIRDLVEAVAAMYPRYGYRRITAALHRQGHMVNHKLVLRLMREQSLLVAVRRYVHTTWSEHSYRRYPNLLLGLMISQPDQVWCADITYVRLAKGFVYLAVILDVYTRLVRSWALGRHLDESLTMAALEMALQRGKPVVHHSDQGVQYCAQSYVAALETAGVAVSMAAMGQPTQNAYVERWIRTLKEEEVYLSEYESFSQAYESIGRFIDDVYNSKRIHSALGYLTPAEFLAAYQANQRRELQSLQSLPTGPTSRTMVMVPA